MRHLVRRTFDNGWMVGLWATKTDVSSKDFGEGSFDKGLFFKFHLVEFSVPIPEQVSQRGSDLFKETEGSI